MTKSHMFFQAGDERVNERGHMRQGRGIPWTSKIMTKCKQMEAHVDLSLMSVKYGPHDSIVVVRGCLKFKLVLSPICSIQTGIQTKLLHVANQLYSLTA